MENSIQIQSGQHLIPIPGPPENKASFSDNFPETLFQVIDTGVKSPVWKHPPEKAFRHLWWLDSLCTCQDLSSIRIGNGLPHLTIHPFDIVQRLVPIWSYGINPFAASAPFGKRIAQ